jgi:hypothetical protein
MYAARYSINYNAYFLQKFAIVVYHLQKATEEYHIKVPIISHIQNKIEIVLPWNFELNEKTLWLKNFDLLSF